MSDNRSMAVTEEQDVNELDQVKQKLRSDAATVKDMPEWSDDQVRVLSYTMYEDVGEFEALGTVRLEVYRDYFLARGDEYLLEDYFRRSEIAGSC
ncbi:MAG: hypothetical protein H8Z69_04675 [Nanohaloarchaea archaeon]|nr:hypothetical protein [Candidatus Nanohaloarchaea archaeon]